MKNIMLVALLVLSKWTLGQSLFDQADAFFSRNVDANGMVNYAGVQKAPEELNDLIDGIANLDLSNKRVTPNYLKAFYINAYNLLVIKQVVDLYPIEGPLQVKGFFDKKEHVIMGEGMTLDRLEKEILYKRFPDPRLHFVLVCAAKGCPPLASYSYKPANLDLQLDERTRMVLNAKSFVRVSKKNTGLPKIFEWYKTDFVKSNESVILYINKYRSEKVPVDKKYGFYEYDWSLNDIKL